MSMKKILLIPLVALLFSCGGATGKYEKLIADVVQTDGKGTKYDLNFKADKLEEIRQITVADSIQVITEAFNADRDKKRAMLQQSLTRNQENLDKERNSRYPGKTMMTFYRKNVDHYTHLIDSLEQTVPAKIAPYENRNGDEILAVIVRCTYTIDEPITNKRATETFDFVLSPDGTKYYSKKRVKE